MKKSLFIAVFAIFALVGCANKNSIVIKGEINKLEGSVILYRGEDKIIEGDVRDGEFEIKTEITSPDFYMLKSGKDEFITRLILEPGDLVNLTGEMSQEQYKDPVIKVTGGRLQGQMAKYRADMDAYYNSLPPEERGKATDESLRHFRETMKKHIEINRDNLYGLQLLGMMIEDMDANYVAQLLQELPANITEHPSAIRLKKRSEMILKTEPGQPYIDITLSNKDGKEISVSSLLAEGKYVLIDFWSSSCVPCMGEMPFLRAAYETYKEKGFEIYAVSNDINRDKWLEAMDKVGMIWTSVTSFQNWEDQFVKAYGVSRIPANFLINPQGVIIGKNLRGVQVETKLAEIFK